MLNVLMYKWIMYGRQKVDLTKYVENHYFVFDEVFNDESNNEEVIISHPLLIFTCECTRRVTHVMSCPCDMFCDC
jgi:hypothetical protein